MKYQYLIPEDVERRLKKENLSSEIYKKLRSYRASDGELTNCSFLGGNVLLSKPGANRYAWFREERKGLCLYVLRDAYTHPNYERELNEGNLSVWKDKHQYSDAEQKEIEGIFDNLGKPEKRQSLPESLREYEDRPREFEEKEMTIIYELPEWVSGFSDIPDKDKRLVYDTLYAVVSEHNSEHNWDKAESKGEFLILRDKDAKYEMVMRLDANASGGKTNGIYLVSVAEKAHTDWDDLHAKDYDCDVCWLETLNDKASKCYPYYILGGFEEWNEIEMDSDANLVLTDEQLGILESIEYPFFVNGLAGSGKSTILYYLFAWVYSYWLKKKENADEEQENQPELLFLSYSPELIKTAQRIVKSILKLHPKLMLKKEVQGIENYFGHVFQPFQAYLRSEFLDNEEATGRFSTDKYIDFRRFKDEYDQRPQFQNLRSKYSADIVWSVIRTFIKGRQGDRYFTPEDYEGEDMQRKDRTVTKEDFKKIYDEVWNKWYKKYFLEGIGWDDLDLVRYILGKKDIGGKFHRYSVIFCDEAQDFTKVETDLILRLSVHSQYDLTASGNELDTKIPIAFAGDPNQTVSPTGFRWGSLQQVFVEAFSDALGSRVKAFSEKVLSVNFRSKEGIVRFANSIQLLRHKLLDDTQSLSLQKPRGYEHFSTAERDVKPNYVAFFNCDQANDWEKMKPGFPKAIVITSDEGEYRVGDSTSDNPEKDPAVDYTNRRFKELGLPEDLTTDKLYTSISSKGLEFPNVILYRFGEDEAVALFEKFMNGQELTSDSEKFRLSHFLTKLYIAVSRAKQVLFIVDTDQGYDRFWKYFVDDTCWASLLPQLNVDVKFLPDLGRMSRGFVDEFVTKLEKGYNPKAYAWELFQKALDSRNPDVMLRAQSAFIEIKWDQQAKKCSAYARLFKGDFEMAGDDFCSLANYDEALQAYWEGRVWKKYLDVYNKHIVSISDDERLKVRKTVALFMSGGITLSDFLSIWHSQEEEFQKSVNNVEQRDHWREVSKKLIADGSRLKGNAISVVMMDHLDALSAYMDWQEKELLCLRASLRFKYAEFMNRTGAKPDVRWLKPGDKGYEHYQKAAECWDEADATQNNKEYFQAQKYTSDTDSDRIHWMWMLDQKADILRFYGKDEQAETLTTAAQNDVLSCWLTKDYNRAIVYPYPKEPDAKWNRLYQADRKKFLVNVVLNEFDQNKFYFLHDKIKMEDETLFDELLSQDVFEKIFALTDRDGKIGIPYWSLFMNRLQNVDGDRVMKGYKNPINRATMLDALNKSLFEKGRLNKDKVSCFLELLFDGAVSLAKQYMPTLERIFSSTRLTMDDFRLSSKANMYFKKDSGLTGGQLDDIKDRIRAFSLSAIKGMKKVGQHDVNLCKALMRAFEVSVPYKTEDEESVPTPDYSVIVKQYMEWARMESLARMKDYIDLRKKLYQLLSNSISLAEFTQDLQGEEFNQDAFVGTLSHDDAAQLVVTLVGQCGHEAFEVDLLIAEMIYKSRLTRDDFFPYCHVKTLCGNLEPVVGRGLETLKNQEGKIDIYAVKILAYVWEAMFDHRDAAKGYHTLVTKSKFVKHKGLEEYLKKRALLHYSYVRESTFEKKQVEYGIEMDRDYMPAVYPHIVKDGEAPAVTADSVPAKPVDTQTADEQTAKTTATRVRNPRTVKKDESPLEVAKRTAMGIARSLKQNGVPLEVIMKSTGLTREEVEAL